MEYLKADMFSRFMAAIIDGIIGWTVVIIPFIGGIIGSFYLLFKDGLMYKIIDDDEWRNRSIGKKLMNLQIQTKENKTVDLALSAKRNIPLVIGSIIAIIPVVGWIIGGIIGLIFGVIEFILLMIDKKGRRLGDRWADTQVVEVGNYFFGADKDKKEFEDLKDISESHNVKSEDFSKNEVE
jgi:uncharacterized RDD family membrane protein YckC